MYRNTLKGLLEYKSIRRRSLTAYCRMMFRKRGKATEKLLIDECIEEARRSIYVLQKNHNFTKTGEYEFDSMAMPKDTGQDVKAYMEDVYDPEISRKHFGRFNDVIPGQEDLHNQKMGPTSGEFQARRRAEEGRSATDDEDDEHEDGITNFKQKITDEDKVFRPPPPPMESGKAFRK
ncbi:Hypothetical protein, putative [Bodo saltans]|uniref:Uncharacterized protein n=1 Tax=Bodo saltans TaxID=75058 RepID=A0A0S4J6D6_BODSA|nr:Hypothetical protein, putative [Bodo saltans]|eukprot:CUG86758.1 Hypothetical protein, putative [Bodo saltans]